MSTNGTILIVEDDEAIATGIAMNLKIAGYACQIAGDGESALAQITSIAPTLVLLDINLPKKSGLAVLEELRRSGNLTPVIVLSARQDEFDKVGALRIGADDYVTKPFALAELLARIDAVMRRARPPRAQSSAAGTEWSFGDVHVDERKRVVIRAGHEVKLTHLEFKLLLFFLHHPHTIFTREDLLKEVWGIEHAGSARTVDNFVGRLRAKLENNPESPAHFLTLRGSGYRFCP